MGRIKTGNGFDGSSNAFAKKGENTLSVHHSPMAARASDHLHGDTSIARNGKPKRLADVPVHNGMTRNQQAGVNLGGMGHGIGIVSGGQTLDGSAAAAPLAHAYGDGVPKVRNAAPIKSGMRSRTGPVARSLTDARPHDVCGQMLLDEAKS